MASRWVCRRLDGDGDGHTDQRRMFAYDGTQNGPTADAAYEPPASAGGGIAGSARCRGHRG